MKSILRFAAGVAGIVWLAPVPVFAQSQLPPDLKNPKVLIEYVAPKNAQYKAIYERLKARLVLERLQVLLGPLKLEKELRIKTDECGAPLVPYKRGEPVSICYEYVDQIESLVNAKLSGGSIGTIGSIRVKREHAIVGPVVHIVLFNVAHALFDILDTPIWGNIDDAADTAAAFVMLQFGEDVTQKTLFGTAWFFKESKDTQPMQMFDVRPFLIQRFYNHLCHAYGSDPALYDEMFQSNTIPEYRAKYCVQDYFKHRESFHQTILDGRVDWKLVERVQKIEWLKDD